MKTEKQIKARIKELKDNMSKNGHDNRAWGIIAGLTWAIETIPVKKPKSLSNK